MSKTKLTLAILIFTLLISFPFFPSYPSPDRSREQLPLISLCRRHKINWEWDEVVRRITLTKGGNVINLLIGSRFVLINGKLQKLEAAVVSDAGIVMVPPSFEKKVLIPLLKIPERGLIHHQIKTIIIDPGHGGYDPGAIGRGGLKEKEVNLDIALRLKKALASYNFKIILTRENDKFISLWQRAHIANKEKADLFISIHANAGRRKSKGFEAFYLSEAVDEDERALKRAEEFSLPLEEDSFSQNHASAVKAILWELTLRENRRQSYTLADVFCQTVTSRIPIVNRGVKYARFYVLRHTNMPAVLVEVGFLSNREEEAMLKNTFYRQMIAEALAKAILSYTRQFEATDGFTI